MQCSIFSRLAVINFCVTVSSLTFSKGVNLLKEIVCFSWNQFFPEMKDTTENDRIGSPKCSVALLLCFVYFYILLVFSFSKSN